MGVDINIHIVSKNDADIYLAPGDRVFMPRYENNKYILSWAREKNMEMPAGDFRRPNDLYYQGWWLDGCFGFVYFTADELIQFLMANWIEALNEDSEWLEVINKLRKLPQDRDPIAIMYFDN